MIRRRGLSLLEVMLSLAIFGTSLAVLGELIRLGARCASDARDLTTAQIYSESLLAEITSGVRPAQSVAEASIETDPNWLYSVRIEPASQPNLLAVTVKVERNLPPGVRRASFSLLRWMPDPGLDLSSSSGNSSAPSSSSALPSSAPAGGASG